MPTRFPQIDFYYTLFRKSMFRQKSPPRLPERKTADDWLEEFSAFTICIEGPKMSSRQQEYYRGILLTLDLTSFRLEGSSLSLTFEDGKRIQFHRSLLSSIIASVGKDVDEFTLANITLLKDLNKKIV